MGSPSLHLSLITAEEARERLTGLISAALDCIISVDRNGKILEFNPAAESTFGIKAAEAIGQAMAELIIPSEYRERHLAGMSRHLDAGEFLSMGRRMELEALRSDGSRFPCELTLTMQRIGAQPVFTAFIRDITERRQYENRTTRLNEHLEFQIEKRNQELKEAVASLQFAREQLERAQAIAKIGDAVFFPKSGLRLWSYETFRLYGFIPDDQTPETRRILSAVYSKDMLSNRVAIERSISGAELYPEIEYRVVHPDGSIHWLKVVSYRDTVGEGKESPIVSIIQEITKQKAAEEEMLRVIETERELGQLKSDFLNMITHEYRTPLGIINSSADILARYHDRLEKEDRLTRIGDIKQSARRLADLVEEVLFLGKSEAGKLKLNYRHIDYGKLVREISDTIVAQFGFPREVNIEIEPLPETCEADEQLARHILNNAISNALKYSTLDQPVFISLRSHREGVRIVVKDLGIGIPKSDQSKLFSMFHRASNVGTISGTGLGLVILKRCVDLLNGTVSVASQPGRGTAFTIWLPFKPPTPDKQSV